MILSYLRGIMGKFKMDFVSTRTLKQFLTLPHPPLTHQLRLSPLLS